MTLTRPNTIEQRLLDLEAAVRAMHATNRLDLASVTLDDGTTVTAADTAQTAVTAGADASQAAADAVTAANTAAQAAADAVAAITAVASATTAAGDAATAAGAALAAAQQASALGESAQSAADAAQAAADAAQADATAAGTSGAQAAADAAQAAADAAQALANAQTAQTTADTASTAAGTAQTAASAAAAAAAAAQATANSATTLATGKVSYITAAAGTGGAGPAWSGAADSAVWIEVLAGAAGRVLHRWDGSAWSTVPWGTPAIATGAVTADLLSATAIDGKVITGTLMQTAASGARVAQGNTVGGITAYNSAGIAVTTISNIDGSITTTKGTITGAVLQTAASGARTTVTQLTTASDAPGGAANVGAVSIYSGAPIEATPCRFYSIGDSSGKTLYLDYGKVTGASGSLQGPVLSMIAIPNDTGTALDKTLSVDYVNTAAFNTTTVKTTGVTRLLNNGDVSLAGTGHALQIGTDLTDTQVATVQTLWDNNEMAARTWNVTTQAWVASNFGMTVSNLQINTPGTLSVPGGKVTALGLDLTGTGDASATTDGALVIGPRTGLNSTFDQNEIVFRNNGVITGNVATTQYVDARSPNVPDAGWTNATLQNGWTAYGSGYATPRYRKLAGNRVEVQGMVTGGTIGATTAVFTLPTGYRPSAQLPFACVGNNAIARVDVLTTGVVAIVVGSSAAWTALNFSFSLG